VAAYRVLAWDANVLEELGEEGVEIALCEIFS